MHHFFRNPPMITGIGQSLALIILGSKKRGERRQPVETSTFKNSIHHWLYKCTLQHEIIQCCLKTPKTKPLFSITHRIHGAGIYANIWGILMVNVTIYSIHGSYGSHFNIIPVKLPWHTRLHPIAFGHVWRKLGLHMLRKRHLEFWCLCTLQASDVWLSLTFSMGNSNQFFQNRRRANVETKPLLNHHYHHFSKTYQVDFNWSFFFFVLHKSSISPWSRSRSFYPSGGSFGAVPDKQKRARGEKNRGTSASKLVAYHGCYHGCISWIQKWWRIDSDTGKRLQKTNWKDPPFFMGKSTNCRTGHFNSYEKTLFIVDLPIKDGH